MGGSVKSPPFYAHIRTLAFILLLKIYLLYFRFQKTFRKKYESLFYCLDMTFSVIFQLSYLQRT